jgi:glycosyltransferase involved in cell wall biosynthesis
MTEDHKNSKPKKICFFALNTFPVFSGKYSDGSGEIGGAELQQAIIGKELEKKGYDISFIIFNNGNPEHEEIDGVTFYKTIEKKYRFSGLTSYFKAFLSIWSSLKRADADFYCQGGADPLTGIISLFCLVRRKKFIFAVMSDMDINGIFSDNLRFLLRMFFHFGLKTAKTIIVQSNYQKDLLKSRFNRDGIIIKNVYPRQSGITPIKKQPVVLWVSTIRPWKQPEVFLELAKSLPNLQFQMIGGSAPKFESYYQKIKKEADAIPNLEFMGFIPFSQIDQYFAASAIFVNTSPHEGFPNTFLQAWAHFSPVISLNVDPDEIICTHKLGYHSKTFNQLVIDVDLLMNNENERREFGKNGRTYVEREHDVECIIQQYSVLF